MGTRDLAHCCAWGNARLIRGCRQSASLAESGERLLERVGRSRKIRVYSYNLKMRHGQKKSINAIGQRIYSHGVRQNAHSTEFTRGSICALDKKLKNAVLRKTSNYIASNRTTVTTAGVKGSTANSKLGPSEQECRSRISRLVIIRGKAALCNRPALMYRRPVRCARWVERADKRCSDEKHATYRFRLSPRKIISDRQGRFQRIIRLLCLHPNQELHQAQPGYRYKHWRCESAVWTQQRYRQQYENTKMHYET